MKAEKGTMPPSKTPRAMRALAFPCLLAVALAGCSHVTAKPAEKAAARPALPEKAMLTLDQLYPLEPLPAPQPATRPAAEVPAEALQLFAQARAALQTGQRFTAVQLLDQALNLDPDSYELHMAMGQAAVGTSLSSRAKPSLERAAQLKPDSADAYLELARLEMQNGQSAHAIKPLRQAQCTSAYQVDTDTAIAVDYYLARALQLCGNDTAALQEYDRLLDRLEKVSAIYRGPVEVMQVIRAPDLLFGEIAVLAGRLGDTKTALNAIDQAILEAPGNRQYAILRVRLLEQAGRPADARQFAVSLFSSFGPSVEVTNLLNEVYANAGGEPAATAALQRAFDRKPNDANVGFALADYLQRAGNLAGAQRILQTLVAQLNYRQDTVDRLFGFYESQGQTLASAQLLVEASARRPEYLSEISLNMAKLSRLSRSNHLRLRDLQNMQVESWAEAARLYWVARIGEMWNRDEAARAALEKAVRIGKPYVPAYRELLNHYWKRHDWDDKRKAKTSQDLILLASMQGNAQLAAELKGMLALRQKKQAEASAAFLEAMRGGDSDPDLLLGYAQLQLLQGNPTETERILLKINEDYPLFEQAYAVLIPFYMDRSLPQNALKTLQRWLNADPKNASARLYQGAIFLAMHRTDAAEKVLLELFDEYADNPKVLGKLLELYQQTGRLDAFINLLEQKRQGRPDIREIAELLAEIYASQQRPAEASRVVDDLRKSAAGDSDLLYYVSSLYVRLDDNKTAEAVLEDVLAIDPAHSSAANDLGYYMAEKNRELDRAQKLVEIAVKEEPDNQAFLDSFGWVMYKRGRFDEACDYLRKAISQTVDPDPIVLDHLGDACYRLGQKGDALKYWEEASRRLGEYESLRTDYRTVGLQIQTKLKQMRLNQPAQTAPTASEANAKKQGEGTKIEQ